MLGQLLCRAQAQQEQGRRRCPLSQRRLRVRSERAAVDHPDRPESLAAGPHRAGEPRQVVPCERRQPHRFVGGAHQPDLVRVLQAARNPKAEDALTAVLIDRLTGHRGIGQDPLARVCRTAFLRLLPPV